MNLEIYLSLAIVSKEIHTITKKEARRLALHCQGLDLKWPFGRGREGVRKAIEQLGYTQLDTISVVERAHHHVLWSRVPDYRKEHLKDLQIKKREIFEYWAHAAAYLPIRDYRYAMPVMRYFREHRDRWPKSKPQIKKEVLQRVREEGPLMSRDFKHPNEKKGDGWWDWKPAKLALQRLFFEGKILVRERTGFQRVYDVPERILPGDTDTSEPSKEEYADFLIRGTIRSHGVATSQTMAYQRRGMHSPVLERLKEHIEAGEIVPVRIRGLGKTQFYSCPELLDHNDVRIMRYMRILSPFDNAVIQRRRVEQLFDYDYQIECYVPKDKRQYGYFCLPLLLGDRFVGRIDAKADRKKSILHLKHVAMERDMDFERFSQKLAEALPAFIEFNDCAHLEIHKVTPKELKPVLLRVVGQVL